MTGGSSNGSNGSNGNGTGYTQLRDEEAGVPQPTLAANPAPVKNGWVYNAAMALTLGSFAGEIGYEWFTYNSIQEGMNTLGLASIGVPVAVALLPGDAIANLALFWPPKKAKQWEEIIKNISFTPSALWQKIKDAPCATFAAALTGTLVGGSMLLSYTAGAYANVMPIIDAWGPWAWFLGGPMMTCGISYYVAMNNARQGAGVDFYLNRGVQARVQPPQEYSAVQLVKGIAALDHRKVALATQSIVSQVTAVGIRMASFGYLMGKLAVKFGASPTSQLVTIMQGVGAASTLVAFGPSRGPDSYAKFNGGIEVENLGKPTEKSHFKRLDLVNQTNRDQVNAEYKATTSKCRRFLDEIGYLVSPMCLAEAATLAYGGIKLAGYIYSAGGIPGFSYVAANAALGTLGGLCGYALYRVAAVTTKLNNLAVENPNIRQAIADRVGISEAQVGENRAPENNVSTTARALGLLAGASTAAARAIIGIGQTSTLLEKTAIPDSERDGASAVTNAIAQNNTAISYGNDVRDNLEKYYIPLAKESWKVAKFVAGGCAKAINQGVTNSKNYATMCKEALFSARRPAAPPAAIDMDVEAGPTTSLTNGRESICKKLQYCCK